MGSRGSDAAIGYQFFVLGQLDAHSREFREIAELRVRCWLADGAAVLPPGEVSEGGLRDNCDMHAIQVVVRTSDGCMAGAARVSFHTQMLNLPDTDNYIGNPVLQSIFDSGSKVACVSRLVIAPPHRAKGLGNWLLRERLEIARSEGATWVTASVHKLHIETMLNVGFDHLESRPGRLMQTSTGERILDRLTHEVMLLRLRG